ncbi:hypothetical protein GCM10007907_10330 [Chitinimonas prasina]|uniref:Lipocalin-like domain-containing protein n=1 Tax=Chitinimonas prasina TaxID=1434937 RepID=A0ABQ5YE13_9NEIS|nr:hypothetical protein [Chitinimonas prasina]GLR12243.1 hypothetical protein GCM10007907_10330 [Chitinimonas prasina]
MDEQDLVGVWHLVGSAHINVDLDLPDDDDDDSAVVDWLYGHSPELLAQLEATGGLTLQVQADGSFRQTCSGEPAVEWFGVNGVLEEKVVPFDGLVNSEGGEHFLLVPDLDWGAPEGEHEQATLRYDDGDTMICDRVALQGAQLIRTVSVVTDEAYGDRVVMAFRRATN